MATKRRFPMKLKLRPGLSRSGKLTVERQEPDGSFLVQWDAQANTGEEPFIYDRAVLRPETVLHWTGVDLRRASDP